MASAIAPPTAPYSPGFSHSGVCITFSQEVEKNTVCIDKVKHSTNCRSEVIYIFEEPEDKKLKEAVCWRLLGDMVQSIACRLASRPE
jgi:hypothetical protein